MRLVSKIHLDFPYIPDLIGHQLAVFLIRVGQDVLNEVVAVLITSNCLVIVRIARLYYAPMLLIVDEGHARATGTCLAHSGKVTIEKIGTTNFQAFLHDLGSKLIGTVLGSKVENMLSGTVLVLRSTVFADVLDTPVSELPVGDDVDADEDLINARALHRTINIHRAAVDDATCLIFFQAILKDVLHNQAASLSKRNLMPHSAKCFVHISHDLRRGIAPAKLEQLLPDVTSIAVDDSLRDATQQFVNHDRLVLLRHCIEGLLYDVAPERVHAEIESIATNRIGDLDHLSWSAMLKAALNQEVAEAVNHERVGLSYNGFDKLKPVLRCAYFELLLEKDGRLLIGIANDPHDNFRRIVDGVTSQHGAVVQVLAWANEGRGGLDLGLHLY